MNDPRDSGAIHEEELTESSSDELADLQKEYEMKAQQLMEKKKEKQERKKREMKTMKQVEKSPSKASNQEPHVPGTSFGQEDQPRVQKSGKPTTQVGQDTIGHRRPMPQSSFIEKLYEANTSKAANLDFSNRRFEFEILPERIDKEVDEVEEYSREHLRKRYVDVAAIRGILKDVKVLRIEKLLAKVAPPSYGEPNYVNWAFVGIVTRKSEPKTAKDKKKFMKLSIGGFDHAVDLMLFGAAFQKHWKLKVGDLIVILNPQINKFTAPFKGFNLKLDDSLDCLVEIGSVKHFGYCAAVKNDNTTCTAVVNTSRASLCAYHLDAKYKKSQNKRMELNGSVQLKSPTKQGAKSSVYMNSSGTGGHFSYERINQETKVYGYSGHRDPKLYQNPKILDNLQSKRKKLRNERVNSLLERKLMNLSQNSSLRKLGLIKNGRTSKETSTQISQAETKNRNETAQGVVSPFGDGDLTTTSTNNPTANPNSKVFDSRTLGRIGFNPIPCAPNKLTTKERGKLPEPLKELYDISSKMKRTLSSSKEDRDSKRSRVQKCMAELRTYENGFDAPKSVVVTGKTQSACDSGKPDSVVASTNAAASAGAGGTTSPHDLDSDSDSDLDIQFADPNSRQVYSAIVGGSRAD